MQLLTSPFVWLRRIRKRCGYGIHSPYAFKFVTGVIYETLPYRPWQELDTQLPFRYRFRVRKMLHLLFRIANHVQPNLVYVSSPMTEVAEYIKAGCNRARLTETLDIQALDMCFLSEPDDVVLTLLHSDSVLFLDNLRQHRQWFRELPSVVSFDLWDVGIAFFDPKYNKQHYTINF